MIKLIEHKITIKETPVLNKDGYITVSIQSIQNIAIDEIDVDDLGVFKIFCITDIDAIADVTVFRNGFKLPVIGFHGIDIKVSAITLYDCYEYESLDKDEITPKMVKEDIKSTLLGGEGTLECNLQDFNTYYSDDSIEALEEIEFGDNYVTIELPDGSIKAIRDAVNNLMEDADGGVEFDYCTKTTIAKINKGDYFTLKPLAEPKESQVWVKDDYDRSSKKYWAYKWSDVNTGREFPGNKEVYTDFTF